MKIFTSQQISELDNYTKEHEQVSGLDLMERAAQAMMEIVVARWGQDTPFVVFAGPGNNGGDALALARLMTERGYAPEVYLFNPKNDLSSECEANKMRLQELSERIKFTEVTQHFELPEITARTVVIDGLFGTGIKRPLTGGFASLVKYINQSAATVVSLDMPSGLMAEDNTNNVWSNIVRATLTLTIHQKKLSMFLADCQPFLGKVLVLDIGLSEEYTEITPSKFHLVEGEDLASLLRRRSDFAHKGAMGHALIAAGSRGMAGAAILAARACMRSGTGKTTVLTPLCNYGIIQSAVPEAVLAYTEDEYRFGTTTDTDDFDALGIGPGMGTDEETAIAFISQIRRTNCNIVADADALNILARHRAWLQQLPQDMILTPHPKEMDRISGSTPGSDYERLQQAMALAVQLKGYVLLKGHYSALCTPAAEVYFNTTGNSGMATAGSGDCLTGIITGLLARGYLPKQAAMLGMYLHGRAGDLAIQHMGKESLIASDIIEALPQAFMELEPTDAT